MNRILVADDDEDIRELLGIILWANGYEVVLVEDGCAALEEIMAGGHDLVVLDNSMPGMTGLEVLEACQTRLEAAQRPPILVLSALTSWQDIQRGYAAGADDYCPKPFVPKDLLRRIAALLGGRSQGRPAAAPRQAHMPLDSPRES